MESKNTYHEIIVENNPDRIEKYLHKKLNIPIILILKLIRQGKILINGKKIKDRNIVLNLNDKILIYQEIVSGEEKKYDKRNVENLICFENKELIIINKPCDLASQGGTKVNCSLDNMIYGLAQESNTNYYLIHRLDITTSGLIFFAKIKEIVMNFNNNAEKYYLTILDGIILKEQKINSPIIDKYSKTLDAETIFIPIYHTKRYTLCLVKLNSGRKHQIRIHANDLNISVLGDEIYEMPNNAENFNINADLTNLLSKNISLSDNFLENIAIKYFPNYLDNLQILQTTKYRNKRKIFLHSFATFFNNTLYSIMPYDWYFWIKTLTQS